MWERERRKGGAGSAMCVCSFNHSIWVQGVWPYLGEVQFSHAQKIVSDEGTIPVVHHKRQRNLDVYTVHILQQERIRTGGLSKSM